MGRIGKGIEIGIGIIKNWHDANDIGDDDTDSGGGGDGDDHDRHTGYRTLPSHRIHKKRTLSALPCICQFSTAFALFVLSCIFVLLIIFAVLDL